MAARAKVWKTHDSVSNATEPYQMPVMPQKVQKQWKKTTTKVSIFSSINSSPLTDTGDLSVGLKSHEKTVTETTLLSQMVFHRLEHNKCTGFDLKTKAASNSNSFLTSSARQKEESSSPSLSERKTLFVLNTVVRISDNIKEAHSVSQTQVLMRDDHSARARLQQLH